MRTFFTFLLVLIIVAAVIIYFLPSTIHIEKTMVLKAAPEPVFQYINATGEWNKWAAWLQQDPSNKITFNGPESGAGAALNWNSQVPDTKTGNVLIQTSQPYSQLKADINFDIYGKSNNTFLLENTGNGTKITWTIDLNVIGWMNKIKALSWKSKIDSWMDASLKNLDQATANAPNVQQPSASDTLKYRLDTLSKSVDSLKNSANKKDTIIRADSIPK
ncbi:MAG: SRPBCC family protein [Chitinophagaceae bacterium]